MPLYDWYLTHPFGVGPRSLVVVYLGHTGGGQLNLDGEPTFPSADDGTEARFIIESSVTASLWQLIASTHIDDPTNGWKRPLDYMDSNNAKVWRRVAVFGTGGGGGSGPPSYYTETWKWTTNLVDASASGRVGLNQTLWAAATEVHLNEVTSGGRDMTLVIAQLFTVNNKILLQDASDSTNYGLFLISGTPVDHGTWWTFPVTLVQAGGLVPSNNNSTIVTILVIDSTGGVTLPHTLNLLAGDGSGGAVNSGIFGPNVVVKNPAFPTPTTLNQVISCLQSAGLCV